VKHPDDFQDCGGRIGPFIGKTGNPDLRNLTANSITCNCGDILIFLTDGIYDNWNLFWSKTPADWQRDVCSELTKICLEEKTPAKIASALIMFALDCTTEVRGYMSRNPSSNTPMDVGGHMDHSTCLVLEIDHNLFN